MAGTDNQETLDLGQTIRLGIEKSLCDLNVAMPCKIVSYDPTKNLAVVQPAFKRKYKSENSAINLPTISNVPVVFPRMGDAQLTLPINKGDEGQLLFNQRSIDGWIDSGGEVDPLDSRKFALSDAVFFPGLHSQSKPLVRKGATTSAELRYKDSYIEIKQDGNIDIVAKDAAFIELYNDGKFKIKNEDEELFTILSELLEILGTTTTNTIFGPMRLNDHPAILLLKTRLDTLKKG